MHIYESIFHHNNFGSYLEMEEATLSSKSDDSWIVYHHVRSF